MLLSTAIGSRTLHSYALIPDACVQRYGSRYAKLHSPPLRRSALPSPLLLGPRLPAHRAALSPPAPIGLCTGAYAGRLASFKFSVFLDDVPLTVLSNGAAATGSSSFVNRYVENYVSTPHARTQHKHAHTSRTPHSSRDPS